jgi:hypothetical protein
MSEELVSNSNSGSNTASEEEYINEQIEEPTNESDNKEIDISPKNDSKLLKQIIKEGKGFYY